LRSTHRHHSIASLQSRHSSFDKTAARRTEHTAARRHAIVVARVVTRSNPIGRKCYSASIARDRRHTPALSSSDVRGAQAMSSSRLRTNRHAVVKSEAHLTNSDADCRHLTRMRSHEELAPEEGLSCTVDFGSSPVFSLWLRSAAPDEARLRTPRPSSRAASRSPSPAPLPTRRASRCWFRAPEASSATPTSRPDRAPPCSWKDVVCVRGAEIILGAPSFMVSSSFSPRVARGKGASRACPIRAGLAEPAPSRGRT
jgi:hypothetical protein